MTVEVRSLAAADVPPALLIDLRQLLIDAFEGDFSDDDWQHTVGGWHVIGSEGGAVVSHAAVVPRTIGVGDVVFAAGYVEAVATTPHRQRQGLGSQVMAEGAVVIRREFDLGVLSTSRADFYRQMGWQRWQGPTFVRDGAQLVRTEDEDDGIMVLRFGPSQAIDLEAPISCDARSGDDW
ncbi:MAG: GNAT family N-acetyltransferase [Sporichthyaceae bacterium]